MSNGCSPRNFSKEYPLPKGPGLPSLQKDWNGDGEIRFYYITTVRWNKDQDGLYQSGCGLNLKTSYATLCTCKRRMLRYIHSHWDQIQIQKQSLYIGVLGNKDCRKPGSKYAPLIFLGKADQSFSSFEALWNFLSHKDQEIKSVMRDPLGDLYPPDSKIPPDCHVHYPKKKYEEDLKDPRPLLFKEWRAWREGGLDLMPEKIENRDIRRQLESLLSKGVPAPYGRPFRLAELKSLIPL